MSIIKKQTVISTIISFIGIFVGTFTQGFVLLRYFEVNEVGLISILLSWSYILAYFAPLGFNQGGIRYFKFFKDNSNKGYLNLGFRFIFTGFSIGLVLFFLLKKFLIGNQSFQDKDLLNKNFYFVYILSLFQIIFSFFENYAKGHLRTIESNFYSQFLQRFLYLIVALLYAFKVIHFNEFLWFMSATFGIQAILMVISADKISKFNFERIELSETPFKNEFINFIKYTFVSGFSGLLILQIDKLLVNKYLGLEQSGIYSFIILYASVMAIGLSMITKSSSSIVLESLSENDFVKIQKIYKKSSYNLFNFGLILFFLTLLNLDDFLSIIKPEYINGKYALYLIGIAKIFDLLTGINGLIISNSKYYKIDAFLNVFYLLILIILNHFLIIKFGLIGAALAFLIANIFYNMIKSIILYQAYKLQPFGIIHLKIFSIFIFCWVLNEIFPNFQFNFMSKIIFRNIFFLGIYIALNLFFNCIPDFKKEK